MLKISIVQGVFYLVDTEGIPLEIIMEELKDRGMMPDWIDFFREALKSGWTFKGTYTRIYNSILNLYGSDFANNWKIRAVPIFKSIKFE